MECLPEASRFFHRKTNMYQTPIKKTKANEPQALFFHLFLEAANFALTFQASSRYQECQPHEGVGHICFTLGNILLWVPLPRHCLVWSELGVLKLRILPFSIHHHSSLCPPAWQVVMLASERVCIYFILH